MYDLKGYVFHFTSAGNPVGYPVTFAQNISKNRDEELYAAVTINCFNKIIVVYGSSNWCSLSYWFGSFANSTISQTENGSISGGSGCMRYPAVATVLSSSAGYHLVWQGTNNTIYYKMLTETQGGTLQQGTAQDISTGSGYDVNVFPSVIALDDNEARVAWLGRNVFEGDDPQKALEGTVVVFRGVNNSNYFWNFDENVSQTQISSTTAGSIGGYILGWVHGQTAPYQNYYMKNSGFYTFLDLQTTGHAVALSNGFSANYADMTAISLTESNGLYHFNPANIGVLGKPKSNELIYSRAGVSFKDSAQITFRFGAIEADGIQITFPEIPQNEVINNLVSVNNYLVSNSFNLNDESVFKYSVKYGSANTRNAEAVLGTEGRVSFKIQLEDAVSNEVLGTYDNVTFTGNSVQQYSNVEYLVSTQGIGTRTVRLRLVLTDGNDMNYALTQKLAPVNILGKKSAVQIHYTGTNTVTAYSLEQNFPNPFNPSTSIRYQIPNAGNVKLVVYDVLGKEVATIVNKEQAPGSYTVTFDGSKLASGVYIYKLTAGNYTATKKLNLLK